MQNLHLRCKWNLFITRVVFTYFDFNLNFAHTYTHSAMCSGSFELVFTSFEIRYVVLPGIFERSPNFLWPISYFFFVDFFFFRFLVYSIASSGRFTFVHLLCPMHPKRSFIYSRSKDFFQCSVLTGPLITFLSRFFYCTLIKQMELSAGDAHKSVIYVPRFNESISQMWINKVHDLVLIKQFDGLRKNSVFKRPFKIRIFASFKRENIRKIISLTGPGRKNVPTLIYFLNAN